MVLDPSQTVTRWKDHDHIQSLPIASGQEHLQPLGILDDMQAADGLIDNALLKDRAHPPVIFGAGGPMLKQFDESTASSRKGSQAPTPPRSVVGIGNKVAKPDYSEAKIVLAMVGLPARGKSYLSNKLMRYLKARTNVSCKVFNVGQLRRSRARQKALQSGIKEDHTAQYFSHNNVEATRIRDKLAEDSLEMLIQWLKRGGNFLQAIRITKILPREVAERDFIKRIKEYEAVYETITEPHLSYLQITNVGNEVTLSRINGYLQSRIAFYLMNLHVKPRSIFFSRHGESQFNVEGKIGGDSPLSERGLQYARALPELVRKHIGHAALTVWTSTLQRTIQTAQDLPYPKLTWKSLDELDAGVCDGMTYAEIEQAYPDDFANRDEDKFNYRYRGGESYRDVVVRLEPVIMELERQGNILIFGHQAILRCLYAYFHDLPQADLPYIKIPLHTVIKLTPKAYGCDEERYTLPIGAVDTHRPKPNALQSEVPVASSAREYYGKLV
ncbi:bifunctional 6-phosphofructo-2-kinase/fructose-2,6-bisphosphate 2-phosphatase [Lanmaoa asiatica]|nr:bifunctional 6-phosphofructo-2-kinase/fructose-2,6-bisphosphate 2-phosphatase [Lanmaoa asiatica]